VIRTSLLDAVSCASPGRNVAGVDDFIDRRRPGVPIRERAVCAEGGDLAARDRWSVSRVFACRRRYPWSTVSVALPRVAASA
jgi:hypothetical protein